MEEQIKLYSNREITIATFFGGPLAAGYLMKKNYQVMGDVQRADKSLLIGILSTIILFAGLFSMPEPVIDKFPPTLIPAVYTAIISLIVTKLQGPFLKAHKENGGLYHTGWKAAGVGAVSMFILLATVAIIAFFTGDLSFRSDFDTVSYDKETAQFSANERKAMEVFKVLKTADVTDLRGEFEKGLVLWKKNKEIVLKIDSFANLPKELHVQNQKLLKYCDLRIQQSGIFIKSIRENTDQYISDVNRIGAEIDKIIKQLQ